MKKLFFVILALVLVIGFFVNADSIPKTTFYGLKDVGIIVTIEGKEKFPTDIIKGAEDIIPAIITALPPEVLKKITFSNPYSPYLKVEFYQNERYHGAYFPGKNKISVYVPAHQECSYYDANYDENGWGIRHILLHEMGHAWDFNNGNFSTSPPQNLTLPYSEIIKWEASPLSLCYYSKKKIERMLKNTTIRDIKEDFAESFAFYIEYPFVFKDYFPIRYDWLKNNVFQRIEYYEYY